MEVASSDVKWMRMVVGKWMVGVVENGKKQSWRGGRRNWVGLKTRGCSCSSKPIVVVAAVDAR